MLTRHRSVLVVPALLVLVVSGCAMGESSSPSAPSPSASAADDGSGSEAAAASTTSCVVDRDWSLDIADMAAQLGASMSGNGVNVTQSEGAGSHTIRFSETGEVSSSVDLTYTLTLVQDELTFTLVQTHAGDSGGEWAWVGDTDTMTFSNWDNSGYTVQNQFLINGMASESAMDIPNETLAGTDLVATCSGSTLTTKATASPFTQRWTTDD